jgi:chromosome segregation ATPase
MNHLLKENRLKQDEVDNACVAIIERGERISTNTVHKEVGERGSFSTIQKMIKDWQARHPEQTATIEKQPEKVEIPESLKTAGNAALKAFWTQAVGLAHSELETQREALKRAENEVNLKMEELQEFSDNQDNTIEVLREQLAQITAKNHELESALTTEQTKTTELTDKLNHARHELELSQIELKALNQRLSDEKTAHENDSSELKAMLGKRDADSDQLRTALENRIKTAEDHAKSLDMQVTKLQTTLDIQDRQITEAKAERADALSAEKAALEKAAVLTGQLEIVLAENKKLQVKTPAKPRQSTKLENKP